MRVNSNSYGSNIGGSKITLWKNPLWNEQNLPDMLAGFHPTMRILRCT
jgi:hypothetical protein